METVTIVIDDIKSDRRLQEFLPWWVEKINSEKHMLNVSEESLKEELLIAIFVLSKDEEIIAAAGIVNGRNKTKTEISFKDKKVVEIGSNFVEESFRKNGIGKMLVLKRLQLCREKGWFPVSITTNPVMLSIFSKLQEFKAISMDSDQQYSSLREELCICHKFSNECLVCPLKQDAGWIFE